MILLIRQPVIGLPFPAISSHGIMEPIVLYDSMNQVASYWSSIPRHSSFSGIGGHGLWLRHSNRVYQLAIVIHLQQQRYSTLIASSHVQQLTPLYWWTSSTLTISNRQLRVSSLKESSGSGQLVWPRCR